jgi:hypothetical protein
VRRVLMLMQLSKFIGRAHVGAALLAALSLVACAATFAQSGRRPPRPQEIAPVPTPTPEPTPPPKDDRAEQKIALLVMADDPNHFYLTTRETDTVHSVVVARLREARALEVSGEARRAGRGEAIKRAKESAGRHVVWLELRPDSPFETRSQRPSPEYFRIDYTVFEPGTAKLLSSGVVHLQRAYGALGRVGLPTCYPVLTHEVEYVYGALEVAERIIKSFSLPIPPRCR